MADVSCRHLLPRPMSTNTYGAELRLLASGATCGYGAVAVMLVIV